MPHQESRNKPTHQQDAIFEQFGYDTTPNIREGGTTLLKFMDVCQNRAILSEFYAMTLFVWIGCGAAVAAQSMVAFDENDIRDNTFLLGVSIAFGFAISVLVYTIAPYSGGHINPAVTFAFWLLRDIDWAHALFYIVAQFLGAMLGAALVWGSMNATVLKQATTGGEGEAPPFLLGANFVTDGEPIGSAFLIEFMGTFLLVWTVLLTAVSKISIAGNLAPIAIGWSVMLAHLVLIPFTGCGINPARSFGPHIVLVMSGYKVAGNGLWVFYVAPFVGAGCAALVCKYILGVRNKENPASQETVIHEFSGDAEEEKEGDDKAGAAETEQPLEEGQEVTAEKEE